MFMNVCMFVDSALEVLRNRAL